MDYGERIDFHINEENGEVSAKVFGDDLEKIASETDENYRLDGKVKVIDFDIIEELGFKTEEEILDNLDLILEKLEEERNKNKINNMDNNKEYSNGYPVVRDKSIRIETIGNYKEYLKEENKKRIEELTKKYMYDFDVEAYQILNDSKECSNEIELNMLLNRLSVEEVIDKVISYCLDRLHECMGRHNFNARSIDSYKQHNYFRIMPYAVCHYTFDGRYLSYMNYDRDFGTYLNELKERLMNEYKVEDNTKIFIKSK